MKTFKDMGQVIIISTDDLIHLAHILSNLISPPHQTEPSKRIPVRLTRRILKEKGYKVKSDASFIAFVKRHNLNREKKGREYWYFQSEIDSLPTLS